MKHFLRAILATLKTDWLIILLSLLGGIALTYGATLSSGSSIHNFGITHCIILGFYFAILFIINKNIFKLLSKRKKGIKKEQYHYAFSLRSFLVIWLIIFLAWVPVLLAYYPAVWSYDVPTQVPSITGEAFTAHHPIIHTILVNSIMVLGGAIGSYEAGMVILAVLQMIVLSAIFAYSIEKICTFIPNQKATKWAKVILVLFFAILPFNSILSISITKDIIFAGFVLLAVIKIYDIIEKKNISKKDAIILIIIMTIMMLFRNNAVYAFVIFAIIAFFLTPSKLRKKVVLIGVSSLASFFIINSSLLYITHAEKGGVFEALSIPTQNLTGVAVLHPELVPEYGTGGKLFGIVSRDTFQEDFNRSFDKSLADPAKFTWAKAATGDNVEISTVIKTWLKYGLQYPLDYVDIYGNLTLGAWYPYDTTHANIYTNVYNDPGYLYTSFKTIDGIDIESYDSKLPQLKERLDQVATHNEQQSYPILSLIFAPATYTWVLIFCVFYRLYKKDKKELIPLILPLTLLATIMLGPCILVRYMYPIMITAPFIIIRTIYRP